MTVTTNNLIVKLKEQLSPEEYQLLVGKLRNEPNSLLSQMSEQPTKATDYFIKELNNMLSKMNNVFQRHGSLVRAMSDIRQYAYNLAERLSGMKLDEIKFVMEYMLQLDDGEFVFDLLTQQLEERLSEKDFEKLSNDERFEAYL